MAGVDLEKVLIVPKVVMLQKVSPLLALCSVKAVRVEILLARGAAGNLSSILLGWNWRRW